MYKDDISEQATVAGLLHLSANKLHSKAKLQRCPSEEAAEL